MIDLRGEMPGPAMSRTASYRAVPGGHGQDLGVGSVLVRHPEQPLTGEARSSPEKVGLSSIARMPGGSLSLADARGMNP